MEKLSLEQLPGVVLELKDQVQRIETLVQKLLEREKPDSRLLSIEQASKVVNLAVSTLYVKVCHSEIPYIKKGKKLYFEEDKLIDWVKGDRHPETRHEGSLDYFDRFRKK
ncbi:MAG: helix-turn-helix domain-containing protein [Candidatus Pseudobacter hemicellulosilyticus]|uniref:Helix-turn-helix domain-containing protein n=1 Tax=Candidatus Pseudobacter hemicellulosilyticus TaxID=3121375 RepID=A0AAJ6BGD9_9BACT|nr:MAG: helix-turn-helix domain-containing protein [Pseudobacter sp.]